MGAPGLETPGFLCTACCTKTGFVTAALVARTLVASALGAKAFVATALLAKAFVAAALLAKAFVAATLLAKAFVAAALLAKAFVAAALLAKAFVAAAFVAAALVGAALVGRGFDLEVFSLGFLLCSTRCFGLGLGAFATVFFVVSCFLETGFVTAALGLGGFCFGGETEALVFFFKLWPEGVFFFPPALEGLAFWVETFRDGFFFEEADLAADFTFLLATLSPSSALRWGVVLPPPRNGPQAFCQSKPSAASVFFLATPAALASKNNLKFKQVDFPGRRRLHGFAWRVLE